MKEIEVRAWCDWVHPDRIPAVIEVRVAVNGGVEHVMDLCADHDMLLAAVMERASPIRPEQSGLPVLPPFSSTCPHPECGFESISRQALSSHLKRMHGNGIRDYPKG